MYHSQSIHLTDGQPHSISVKQAFTAAHETFTRREYYALEIRIDELDLTLFLTPDQLKELQEKIANPFIRED